MNVYDELLIQDLKNILSHSFILQMDFGAAEAAIVDHVIHGQARFVVRLLPVTADHDLIGTMQVRVDEGVKEDDQRREDQQHLDSNKLGFNNNNGVMYDIGDLGEPNVTRLLAGEPIPCGTVIWEFYSTVTDDSMIGQLTASVRTHDLKGDVTGDISSGSVGTGDLTGGDNVANDRLINERKAQTSASSNDNHLTEISLKLDETGSIMPLTNPHIQGLRFEAKQNPIKGSYGDLSHAVFGWEPCSAVERLGLEALYTHPAGRGLLLYVIVSAYPSLALPGHYVILNNRLRFAKYVTGDANVSVRRSCAKVKVMGEKQVIFVDQVVATRDIATGSEITRDFKTIKELEDVEF